MHGLLMRERMRNKGKFLSIVLAPAVAIAVLDQVDGPAPERFPLARPHFPLLLINFNQRTGRKDISHGVISESDECITVAGGMQLLLHLFRHISPKLGIGTQQISLAQANLRVEV